MLFIYASIIKFTESTNKTEAYNGFSKWFFFGGDGIMCENDPEEQSKIIKYNDLLANAVILHNVVDISNAIERLNEEGIVVKREDIKVMSPYMTSHIKRFGEYIIDLDDFSFTFNTLSSYDSYNYVTCRF